MKSVQRHSGFSDERRLMRSLYFLYLSSMENFAG
jgi:hypothetical protein